ncbi:hypothetical protein ANCDUO_13509 [Ancylostoma duodenale]|uniref:Uncharacterized protein n=1 Tax=Ancylostoma duodenale TaxID=51022 RepID=A0A0C2GGU3_9BILA|nr:hypothetical protein ANCDUO_13509 [Ancylostoma duodenale]
MNGSEWSAPPRYIYANAGQLHKPNSSTVVENRVVMPSEPRVIPIRRLDTGYEPRRGTASSASDSYGNELISWNDDSRYDRRRKPDFIDSYDEVEPNHFREREIRDRETRHRSRPHQTPARSQSSHAVAVHDRTFRLIDKFSLVLFAGCSKECLQG